MNQHQTQQDQGKRKARTKAITGAANNGSGLIRITCVAHGFQDAQRVNIANVGGTVEANGKNQRIVLAGVNAFDLFGSTFTNAYTSGGTATSTQG